MRRIYSFILTALLLLGVGNAWAYTIYGRAYFDNTNSGWTTSSSQKILFFPEKNDAYGSQGLEMTAVPNTKLYYWNDGWGDGKVTCMRFACVTSNTDDNWGWSTSSSYDRLYNKSYCVGVTGTATVDVHNKSVLFIAGTGTYDNTHFPALETPQTYDSYTGLNSTQTVYSAVRIIDGSNDYQQANSKATISITSYAMSGEGTTAKQTASLLTSASSQTFSAARTATTTLSVGDVADGYEFVGWYSSLTGGAPLSIETSYTYYPTGATTVYARFHQTTYTRPDITAANIWGTICLPVGGEIDNATLYSIAGQDASKIYLAEEGTTLTAGMPYIFKSSAATPTVTLSSENFEATPLSENGFNPANGLYGQYVDTRFDTFGEFSTIYVVRDDRIQKANRQSGVLANRAFINTNLISGGKPETAPGRPIVSMPFGENNATSIESIDASDRAVKFFENGELRIQRNGIIYDATGRAIR